MLYRFDILNPANVERPGNLRCATLVHNYLMILTGTLKEIEKVDELNFPTDFIVHINDADQGVVYDQKEGLVTITSTSNIAKNFQLVLTNTWAKDVVSYRTLSVQ